MASYLDHALPTIADVGLMACLSIAYGHSSRLGIGRRDRAVLVGVSFGLASGLSAFYHAAGRSILMPDNAAIFAGFASAFLGSAGGVSALVTAIAVTLAARTAAPLDIVQMVLAVTAGAGWNALSQGAGRRNLGSLLTLGALINAAMLPAYVFYDAGFVLPAGVAVLLSLAINLTVAVLIGNFIERERAMLESELQLRRLANTDQLTGLYNRRTLMAAFENRTNKRGQALLLIDVDNFKSVNDAHGHAAGDQVLRHIAFHLQALVRTGDILSRFGGEEFALLISAASSDEAVAAAERLRVDVERNRVKIGQLALQVTVSIGTAWWTGDAAFEDKLKTADAALYRAKREGRNCVRLGEGVAHAMPEMAQ